MNLDLEAEYNNRARVPASTAIIAGWARDAAAYREIMPPRVVGYGGGERHRFDLFEAGSGPAMMFIHGGYWQALDKSFFSHMAAGLNALGVSVAVPSYDLCPVVRIGDIVQQMRAAAATLHNMTNAPLIISGHSAGGHLAACLLATETHVAAAYAISGLFDLAPLIPTSLNAALGLDETEAKALSPLFWTPPLGKTLNVVVGDEESNEFLRQSSAITSAWGAAGVQTQYQEVKNANHFTVIEALSDPRSSMCKRLRHLADVIRNGAQV